MAALYDVTNGNLITDGLQGCNVCDEAIQAAERIADRRGVPSSDVPYRPHRNTLIL